MTADATSQPDTADLEHARLQRTIAGLDDETLIWMMLVLHSNIERDGVPFSFTTAKAQMVTRIVFSEIARRWLPLDTFGAAFRRLYADDADE